MRLKDIAYINRYVLPESTDPAYSFKYIDISSVSGLGEISVPSELVSFDAAPSRARRLAPKGSSVISTVRTYLRAIAPVPKCDEPLVFSTGFAIVEPKSNVVDSRFLAYLCRSDPFIDEVVARSVGVSYPAINPHELGGIPVNLPNIDEQRRVADFLDGELSIIDRLSRGRHKQLELLEEESQARVRSAVCFGLGRRDVTGPRIHWLGSVNPEWPIINLRRIGPTYTGTTFPHEYQGQSEGDYPFVKVADFATSNPDGSLVAAENWVTREVAAKLNARIVPSNSIAYARVGAAMLLNQRRLLLQPCIVDDNVRALHVTRGDPHYWMFLLSLLDLGGLANPGPVPSVSEGQVAAIRVPCPPMVTQVEISSMLRVQIDQIRRLRARLKDQVTLLTERRQALITAAVTGRIDVMTARRISKPEGVAK